MERESIDSSLIASLGYLAAERMVEVEIRGNGRIYQYFDVPPEEYAAFRQALSKGIYFNEVFKLKDYRYVRIS